MVYSNHSCSMRYTQTHPSVVCPNCNLGMRRISDHSISGCTSDILHTTRTCIFTSPSVAYFQDTCRRILLRPSKAYLSRSQNMRRNPSRSTEVYPSEYCMTHKSKNLATIVVCHWGISPRIPSYPSMVRSNHIPRTKRRPSRSILACVYCSPHI